jgi:hypothetical protein
VEPGIIRADAPAQLEIAWDTPPPWSSRLEDELAYRVEVRPAIIQKAQQMLEVVGRVAVVELG